MKLFKDLSPIIESSKKKFKELKKKYPKIDGTLFFSSRYGQAELTSGIKIIKEFPEMFIHDELFNTINSDFSNLEKFNGDLEILKEAKVHATKLDEKKNEIKKKDMEIRNLEQTIKEKASSLVIKDDVFVEIRFDTLDRDLIDQLQVDPLLMPHTPIGKEWIRVVLAKVSEIN